MTARVPLTLTISNGNRATLQVAPMADMPEATNKNLFADRMAARAELCAVYAGLKGCKVTQQDLFEALSLGTDAAGDLQDEAQAIANSLKEAGLVSSVSRVKRIEAAGWPALAYMTSGQVILVLGEEGDDLVIYDKTCTDHRARASKSEFGAFFAGLVVRADIALEAVEDRHLTAKKRHWFWGEFHKFRKPFGEIAIGSFVANLLAVSVALFSLQVYDRVIPHQSEATLWVLAIGAGLALLMEAFLKIARARLMDGAGRQIELSVLYLLMRRVMRMRSDTSEQPSMTFSAMREFGSVREFFTAATIGTLADVPFIFVFLLLVASIAGPVVWVLIAGGILMLIPGFFLQRRMVRLTEETQGASAKSSRLLHEVIFERDTVKTQRAEDRVLRVWEELTALSALKSSEQRKIASTLTFWAQGVQQMTYVGAVIMGTYLVFAGQFTVGTIIAVGILTSRTLAPLTQLAGTMARWGNVKAALDGLDRIVDAPSDAEDGRTYLRRDALEGRYELHELGFAYDPDGGPTLDVPGVTIKAGQRVAVLGANGAGKSSLLKVLSGLYGPTKGRILIDGTEMSQIEPRDLRRLIGYLGQDVRLFSGTLRDNLNLTLLERDDNRLMDALDFAGLGAFVRTHPKGLDLEIFDGGQGLSIGQRQSLGWARLWLQDPQVCLLDEPTAALDQTLERTLVARLDAWLAGRTAIIATHRMPILSLTERVLVLQQGRLVVDGPKEQVLAQLNSTSTAVPVQEAKA